MNKGQGKDVVKVGAAEADQKATDAKALAENQARIQQLERNIAELKKLEALKSGGAESGNTYGKVSGEAAKRAAKAKAGNPEVDKKNLLEKAQDAAKSAVDDWVEKQGDNKAAMAAGAIATAVIEVFMPEAYWELIPVGKLAKIAKKGAEVVGIIKKGEKAAEAAQDLKKAEKAAEKARDAKKAEHAGKDAKKAGGGKDAQVKKKKKKKEDKPSNCCPKNKGPGNKSVRSRRPVHFGTGEEILPQTDFVIEGATPFAWTRTYRSGSECEDWGLLGARWATPFTASLSVCNDKGIVYHEDSGRALRLPMLTVGQAHDHNGEGFILRRDSEGRFTLTWRDGSTDTFEHSMADVLPHGFDGVNAMLAPRSPLQVARFDLTCSTGRDGQGIHVERLYDARPGQVLLRLRTDEGMVLEALRALGPLDEAPRIDRIEEVRPDGTRICHVRYRYSAEAETAMPSALAADAATTSSTPAQQAFARLPRRYNLIAQTDLAGQSRTYTYCHHLLLAYTTYSGFEHGLDWMSLEALRARWGGSTLDEAELAKHHPITLDNSYKARAIRTMTADGLDEVRIDYVDADTTRVTEADGGVLEYTFNHQWLATEVRRVPSDGGAPRSLGRREWDTNGNLTAEIDANGRTTRFAYDGAGNLTAITDARGQISRFDYDAHNQPVAVTDALGHTTQHRFDDAGRILERADALGHTTRYHYDARGRLARLTDARGGNKTLAYDAAGRLVAFTDCSGFTQRYAYDPAGRLIAQADAQDQRSHYRYDALGRLVTVVHPDQSTESYAYDADDNLTAHTDALGQVTRYRYNGHGLPVERIDTKGQTLQYHYDRALRLVELINGNGESYRFTYDAESRLTSETGFDGKTTTYSYDDAGQLIGSASADQTHSFVRDALGQLLAKTGPLGHERYAYDALGRLTAVASAHAEYRYGYDALGQLVEERLAYTLQPGTPVKAAVPTAAFVLTHTYDPLGNRLRTTLPNGRTVDTLRYGSGHWHGTLWQGQSLVDLERDSLHRETSRQFGRGAERLSAQRAYDPQSRLIAFSLARGQRRLQARRYTYDEVGNLTAIDDAQRGRSTYRYDPLGQLLAAVQPTLSETFAFDPAGNLLDTVAAAIPSSNQEAGAANDVFSTPPNADQPSPGTPVPRLARVTHNLLRQYLGTTYEYDVQGNTVLKRAVAVAHGVGANEAATLAFAYDADNRLIEARRTWSQTRERARYTYDAFGRRIAKCVSEETLATGETLRAATTLFVWDGDVLAQEIQPDRTITYLYEPDSFVPLAQIESAEGRTAYAPERVHLAHQAQWELPTPTDEAIAHLRAYAAHQHAQREHAHQADWQARLAQAESTASADTIRYYHCDHLGTPLELLDESGKTVWAAHYKAWGRIQRYDTREVEQPLRFQGQYEDAETGLFYNRHRYYDPDAARFITQDPIGLLGGANLYQYAPNPTGWIDPQGLAKKKGGCDPCCGRDPAAEARSWQGVSKSNPNNPYKYRDTFTNVVLKKGTILYSLYPGAAPGFAVTNHALLKAKGDPTAYYGATQVSMDPGKDPAGNPRTLRTNVRVYRVKEDICVAKGVARANTQFGPGGATQYYVSPTDVGKLSIGKTRPL